MQEGWRARRCGWVPAGRRRAAAAAARPVAGAWNKLRRVPLFWRTPSASSGASIPRSLGDLALALRPGEAAARSLHAL